METIPYHPLVEITQDQLGKIREIYGVNDPKRIQESLDAIEGWCKKQDHLVSALKYLNRTVLERLFILSRGSVEGTKIKIDKLLTARGMMPEICLNKTVAEFENLWTYVNYIPLPKLNPSDLSRVMVTQMLTENLDNLTLLSYLRYCFLMGEYRLSVDYILGERFIVDLSNTNISLIPKLNPILLKKAEVLCTEGFGTKIKGIHIINAPSFVDKVVFILKQGLKEKVASRLHVHSSYEDLQKHIAREVLPKDYGGNGPNLAKLSELWKETLNTEEARKIIDESNKLVSDETKRSSAKFNEEYLGMPGSFRRLNVD